MQAIDYVRIKNYKCLREFEFKPCRINVYVGRNNTGKSSVLEAISLAISSLNDFKDLMENDLISIAIRGEDSWLHGFKITPLPLKYLINIDSENVKSEITLKRDDANLKLCLEYFKEGCLESEVGVDFLRYIDNLARKRAEATIKRDQLHRLYHLYLDMKTSGKTEEYERLLKKLEQEIELEKEKILNNLINMEKIFLNTYLNNQILHASCIFANGKRHTFIKKVSAIPPLFFSATEVNKLYLLRNLHDQLVKTNRLSQALDELRINVEGFDDIRESEGRLYCIYQNLRDPIPLGFMGDGFVALVYMTFLTTFVENGVAILEEPETNMHPGYLEVLAEEIVKSRNVQFFISTHSLELIESLIRHAEEKGFDKDIQFIRMHRIDNEIGYEILSCEDAKYEIDVIKADLRGT